MKTLSTMDDLTLGELKRLGKEFLDVLKLEPTVEEAQNAFKCFSLGYLRGNFTEGHEEVQAAALLKILSLELIKFEAAHGVIA